MWEDPIVAEVHRTRDMLAAKFNYDLKAIFADLRRRQEELGDRLIREPKMVTPSTEDGNAAVDVHTAECDAAASAPTP